MLQHIKDCVGTSEKRKDDKTGVIWTIMNAILECGHYHKVETTGWLGGRINCEACDNEKLGELTNGKRN